jgi:hypothetical protein
MADAISQPLDKQGDASSSHAPFRPQVFLDMTALDREEKAFKECISNGAHGTRLPQADLFCSLKV